MSGFSFGQGQNSQHCVLRRVNHKSGQILDWTEGSLGLLDKKERKKNYLKCRELREGKSKAETEPAIRLAPGIYLSQINARGNFSHGSLSVSHSPRLESQPFNQHSPEIQQHPSSKMVYHSCAKS